MMGPLTFNPCEELVLAEPLAQLAGEIRRSSNFRFAWQFFDSGSRAVTSPEGARALLEGVTVVAEWHRFLRATFEPMYEPDFGIEPIHEHAIVEMAQHEFANTLARAAGDRLGAYSRDLHDATPSELQRIEDLFGKNGPFVAFQLLPGNHPGCKQCAHHNNHLFSSWFYGVAWDWCFVLSWPESHRAWIGCLTDTD